MLIRATTSVKVMRGDPPVAQIVRPGDGAFELDDATAAYLIDTGAAEKASPPAHAGVDAMFAAAERANAEKMAAEAAAAMKNAAKRAAAETAGQAPRPAKKTA